METEARIKYKKQWYLQNKDKEEYKQREKENNKRYRERHREEINNKQRGKGQKYKEKNRDYYLEYSKNYYQENKNKWDSYNNKDSFICVYRFISKDKDKGILRVGSTANLKMRVANYMCNGLNGIKLMEWFQDYQLDKIEYIMISSDRVTAYMVEYNLINKYDSMLNEKEGLEFEIWDEDVEDLWQEWEGLNYYKNKYEDLL